MKKKILCLALCAIMVFACFIGCEEESREDIMNKIGKDASVNASTVTMYLLAEEKVGPEQEALVEDAVNEIMATYDVYVDLVYETADKYYEKLEGNLKTMKDVATAEKEAKKDKTTSAETAEGETAAATEAVTEKEDEYLYIDENGLPKVYYPPNPEYHVDIFYFSGYDRYIKYRDADYLADFSKPIKDTNAKAITHGVSTVLYNAVKTLNGKYDMMPCNTQVGEYTYLLLNKDLLASTQYTSAQIDNILSDNCADFLKLVNDHYPEYVPLYSSEGTLTFDTVKFLGADAKGFASDEFSLIAGSYDRSWKYGEDDQYPVMGKLTDVADNGTVSVKEQITKLKNYEFNGYYATDADKNKPFAVGYVKGDITLPEQYEDDYEVLVLERPTLETERLYDHAFAISKNTKQLNKTALVLSEIYTNETIINLLAHGIENTNYVWTDSEIRNETTHEFYRVINAIDDDPKYSYKMDPEKIGNGAKAYPTVNDDPRKTDNILEQNYQASFALTFGFSIYDQKANSAALQKIAGYSAEAKKLLADAKDAAALDAAFAQIDKLLEKEEFAAPLKSIVTAYEKVVK